MSQDKTQYQSPEQQASSRAQSLSSTQPPAEVDGYTMLQHLGAGAFGEVWLALDNTTRRRVAIKFYSRRSVTDVRGLAREVEKLVTLSADRYVVQLLDVGWDATPPFYVMDYIERGSLEDLLKSERRLPVSEAVEIFHEVAVGLMHLHGKGVLHCDLKPGNVLLDEDNRPRLADFGQSRLSNEAAPSLGTLFYMAPEQADLEAIPDARWDVYALGALLYVMLVGRPPYFDHTLSGHLESTDDIIHRLEAYRKGIAEAELPSKHRTVQGVDRQLAEIIERCITSDPKKRFPSVQSVLLALKQRHDVISRRPLLFLGIVGPLLLLSILVIFGWNAYRQAVVDSDAAITQKAVESNLFAAKFAARSAAEQIDRYFREVNLLAAQEDFQILLQDLLEDEAFKELRLVLSDPNRNNDQELRWVRSEFLAFDKRETLQRFLREYVEARAASNIASWWVYDLQGNQLVGMFDQDDTEGLQDQSNTLGRNYSFRSYFTGQASDLVDEFPDAPRKYTVSQDPGQRVHIIAPNISSVFLSEQSQTWKIAFSMPLLRNGAIFAIAGVTVEMGEFIDFDSGNNQYAVMFDTRVGKHQGIILEHPLFNEVKRTDRKQMRTLLDLRVASERFDTQPALDPVGETEIGSEYQGPKLAASAPIEFARLDVSDTARQDSGLSVAVFEDYASVIRPSHELGGRLFRMAGWAAGFLLAVALLMWLLVSRMMRATRLGTVRAFAGLTDTELSEAAASLDNVQSEDQTGPNAHDESTTRLKRD
ncbi:MAG: protein kinase [Pirellulaceae bacterium]